MADIKDRLKLIEALRAKGGLVTAAQLEAKRDELRERRASGALEIEHQLRGEVVNDEDETFFLVRNEYPLIMHHGALPLDTLLDTSPEQIAFAACDEELDDFNPESAVFVDTETTGLAGGTGTMAFLVGAGYVDGDVFRVEQCFMRDYDEEPPMLRYLDNLFKRFSVVVTYNGKSFDVPLLRSRFISNRMRFRLDAVTHLDLVHVSRRLWKQRLGDCSLGNIERNILGVHRVNDVPSAEIPQIWLDYLHTRDATKLARVFRHHETDIISLAALTGAVSKQLSAPDGEGFEHAEDRLSVLRLLMRRRKYEEAVSHGDNLLSSETDLSPALRQECHELLALAHKRLQHWEEFECVWRRLLESFPSNMGARLELAKHHEHRTREFPEAIRICKEALSILEVREGIGRGFDVGELYHETFSRRIERIQGKMDRRAAGLTRKPKKSKNRNLFEEQEENSDD